MNKRIGRLLIVAALITTACNEATPPATEVPENALFQSIDPSVSGITFANEVKETEEDNYFTYHYFYNGGGVAVGDIDNDGLPDIYLSGNQVKNKLYRNLGDMRFEDISDASRTSVGVGWKTGVSMVDVNADGWLDIYICRAGRTHDAALRRNLLLINNQDNTFSERAAEYGLDDPGYSTQAYWWDYDRDGDLDMYLVNHRIDFSNNTKIDSEIARDMRPESSDQLYRNDGQKFTNVTSEAGIRNKCWGLSASIADFNADGWPDIYVANDFLEPDLLYVNNQDGTFSERGKVHFDHISFYGMGSDVGDINNDGLLDLMVLDMVAQDHVRSKRNMASMSNANFWTMVNVGYHYQYMLNTLQLNNGNGSYSEIAQMAGVHQTDWSWAPLFADFDNDGYQDLFVTNGIKRDVTDNDFKLKVQEARLTNTRFTTSEALDMLPSTVLPNYMFRNNGNLTFANVSKEWGLGEKVNSNGCAYADFDRDGDLDIVTNNLDGPASLYRNTQSQGAWIMVQLEGPVANPAGIGARLEVRDDDKLYVRENYLSRGFHSSVADPLHVGLGTVGDGAIDHMRIIWPDGSTQTRFGVAVNTSVTFKHTEARPGTDETQDDQPIFERITPESLGLDFVHIENRYDDFVKEILLPHRYSQHGPPLTVGDLNGDGLDDMHLGGARDQAGVLFIQQRDGRFARHPDQGAFEADARYEDTGAALIDYDGDGDLDLYVASGGNESPAGDATYQDRLYRNNGAGGFTRDQSALPRITSSSLAVAAGDIDGDGDADLAVGGRVVPAAYPQAPQSFILINEGGKFSDQTPDAFRNIGMVSALEIADLDSDGQFELLATGEWMGLSILQYHGGTWTKTDISSDIGWYYGMHVGDFNADGFQDILLGNIGLNNKYQPTQAYPLHVFYNDFDENGAYDIVLSKDKGDKLLPVRGRECSSEQMPFIKEEFPTYSAFAHATLEEIYGDNLDDALHLKATDFAHSIYYGDGKLSFTKSELPMSTQRAPILGAVEIDINGDGKAELLTAGNFHMAEVETIRYDAGVGAVLQWRDEECIALPATQTGLYLEGDVKDVGVVRLASGHIIVVATRNNAELIVYRVNPNRDAL